VQVASAGHCQWEATLHLMPEVFPLKRYPQFEDTLNRTTADPLTSLLTVLARVRGEQLASSIEITVRPATHRRHRRAKRCLRRLGSPFLRTHPRFAYLYLHLALSRHA